MKDGERESRPQPGKEDPEITPEEGSEGGEACRCKETRDKTFPQVMKLMLKDLAFWKKEK